MEKKGLNSKGPAKGNRGTTNGSGDATTLILNTFVSLPLSLERPYSVRHNSFK